MQSTRYYASAILAALALVGLTACGPNPEHVQLQNKYQELEKQLAAEQQVWVAVAVDVAEGDPSAAGVGGKGPPMTDTKYLPEGRQTVALASSPTAMSGL